MAVSSKTLRIQVKYRRFAFKFGLGVVAVKECRSSPAPAPIASFAMALKDEREPREVRRALRAEILKRLETRLGNDPGK